MIDLVFRYVKEEDIDITLVAEVNKKAVITYGWYVDRGWTWPFRFPAANWQ